MAVVNEDQYIQHNPQTHEGSEGLAALFKRLSKSSPRVNVVRAFEDGDYVFAHTEYDFAQSNIGFEIFRFDGEQAVEHWDNIQQRFGPNSSGRSMVDGPTEALELNLTEVNRALVGSYVDQVLLNRELEKLDDYICGEHYVQHNPFIADGLLALRNSLEAKTEQGYSITYKKHHRILAEGNFVLSVNEGFSNGDHSALFDLYRVADGKLVEHWDTIEKIPPRAEWKNDNGKF